MNKFKKLAIKIAAPAITFVPALSALAQIQSPTINADVSVTDVTSAKARIVNIGNTFIGIIGLVAVVMLIYGGWLYVTAGTNEDNTKKAKGILLWAMLGLGLAVLSYAIVNIFVDLIVSGS